MTLAGDRLAAAQLAGHRAIDKAMMPLAAAVEAVVMRHARPDQNGVLRLTAASRATILLEIGRILDGARPALLGAILGAVGDAIGAAQVGVEPLAHDVTTMAEAVVVRRQTWTALGTDRPSVIGQVGALLARGIAANAAATTVAKQVRQYFSSWFSQYRSETGALLHRERKGAIQNWPGRAGQASQHARGVMLWETTAAHGRTMRRIAVRDNGLLKFHVSHKHLEIDICDRLERQDVGFGPGIYLPSEAPSVPQHFRCRCWLEMASRPRFLTLSESVPA